MITSTSNPQIKNLIQLNRKVKARRQQQMYVAEGVRMVREAPPDELEMIYVSESFRSQPQNEEMLAGRRYEVLSDSVFAHVSDTKTPQGILCLMRMRQYSLDDMMLMPDVMLLVLENLQDPGNLGTVFRTGEGAGITGIILDDSTVDVYNPKTVRSTMGSIYRIPFFVTEDLVGTLATLRSRGIRIFAAHLDEGICYTETDFTQSTAFLIGNEGNGLTKSALEASDFHVRIPMRGRLESLNASMAAGILMYEADRQRRKKEIQ